ncbi:hypothetical protein L2E82_27907 [Cichorium intybus]|uniref:Uncharacterized protein n=1 Tax=Cichorium intybus TaxID=13427 RepID=A0ACB9CUX5_CICIN|nr:hypothetical protein L2E82_27907 [Cichorium intybus]
MMNEIRPSFDSILSSKSEWNGNEQGGCFDYTTDRSCWYWLHSDQEHEYVANVQNQPWTGNTNCRGHDNKVLGPWSLFNYSVHCEIKWEDLTIRERIGRGSSGSVYHAVWHGSDVALKFFFKQENSQDVIVSFTHEVSLMKRIRHPNILLFMGTVTSPQHIGIVTEFLRRSGIQSPPQIQCIHTCENDIKLFHMHLNGNLFELLRRNRARLDWRRRIRMAIDIAQGINYLHNCLPPIIHHDLKSSNLLVGKDWTVKPEWTAPEVLRNEQADERSNIYSYGVVLWEITTEKIPWNGLNSMQVMEAVGFFNQGLDIPKDVHPRWASLIQRCLCSEPESRPTFQEILDELKDLHMEFMFKLPLHEESRAKRNWKI